VFVDDDGCESCQDGEHGAFGRRQGKQVIPRHADCETAQTHKYINQTQHAGRPLRGITIGFVKTFTTAASGEKAVSTEISPLANCLFTLTER
jgi:hypothetical protein